MKLAAVIIISIGLLSTMITSAEENLINNGGAEQGVNNWRNIDILYQGARTGEQCFTVTGRATLSSIQLIPIDVTKTYELSGWFRSLGDKQSVIYYGFIPFDANREFIAPEHVLTVPGTDTQLAAPCKKDKKIIKVKNGEKWKPGIYMSIVFNTNNSGKYTDLPNKTGTPFGIVKVEKKAEHWDIYLKYPCAQAYPAGTNVREHTSGGGNLYTAASRKIIPDKWTKVSGKISGTSLNTYSETKWRPGTKYAKIMIFANLSKADKTYKLVFDDLELKEIKK